MDSGLAGTRAPMESARLTFPLSFSLASVEVTTLFCKLTFSRWQGNGCWQTPVLILRADSPKNRADSQGRLVGPAGLCAQPWAKHIAGR